MKIAFVLTQSLDSPSGLGRYGPLARELARLGHRVQVIGLHYAWDRLPQTRIVTDGVEVIYAGQMHVRKEGPRKLYPSPGELLWISLASTLRLARALRRSDAEVVHLGKPQPYNVLAARLGGRGRPLFCDCDDYEVATNRTSSGWQRAVIRYFEDGVVRWMRGLTVNTRFTQRRYEQLGFPAARIQYVPNGVERNRFAHLSSLDVRKRWNLPPTCPLVVYVGTLGLHSHPVDLLLRAFVTVKSAVPGVRLMLVGSGEDYDFLRAEAARLDIADQTVFTGRVQPDEVPAYYAAATVTADPVHDDLIARARSPLKVVESLAAGTPVVTGDVGDRHNMLAEPTRGTLVPPGDADALAAGLQSWLQQPRQPLRFGERWYWDTLVHDFTKIYRV